MGQRPTAQDEEGFSDKGHEPLQARPQARHPHPRHLRDPPPSSAPTKASRKNAARAFPASSSLEYDAIRTEHTTASQAHGRGLRRLPQRQGDRYALPAHRRGARRLRSRGPAASTPKRSLRLAGATACAADGGDDETREPDRPRKQGAAHPRVRSRHGDAGLRSPRRSPWRHRRLQGPHRRRLESLRGPQPTPRSRRKLPPPRWEPSGADAPRGRGPKGSPPLFPFPGASRRPNRRSPPTTVSFNPLKANGQLFTHLPQLCKLATHVPSGPLWVHEIKFDGYRMAIRTTPARSSSSPAPGSTGPPNIPQPPPP